VSIKLISMAFEVEALKATPRFVLVALAEHADDKGRCYPSIARLARRTGLSERAVQSSIKRLCAAGFINVELNAGKRGTNVYVLRLIPAGEAPPQELHPEAAAPHPRGKCTPLTVKNRQKGTPLPPLRPAQTNRASRPFPLAASGPSLVESEPSG